MYKALASIIIIVLVAIGSQVGKIVAMLIWNKDTIVKMNDDPEYKLFRRNFGVGVFLSFLIIISIVMNELNVVTVFGLLGVVLCALSLVRFSKAVKKVKDLEEYIENYKDDEKSES